MKYAFLVFLCMAGVIIFQFNHKNTAAEIYYHKKKEECFSQGQDLVGLGKWPDRKLFCSKKGKDL